MMCGEGLKPDSGARSKRSSPMPFSVELDEETAAVVQELAASEKRSAGEVIRDAVAAYPGRRTRPLPKGVGKYRSGYRDTAEKVDEILSDAVREGLWP
jgi:predicted transcriptional regulator